MKKNNQTFRTRSTHNTDGKLIKPTAWLVCCGDHAYAGTCATVEREVLEGDWTCVECAKFTASERARLLKALSAPDFSHTTTRGNYGRMGCVYRKNADGSTRVTLSGSFDPHCPEALALVLAANGRPHNGPRS